MMTIKEALVGVLQHPTMMRLIDEYTALNQEMIDAYPINSELDMTIRAVIRNPAQNALRLSTRRHIDRMK